MTEGTREMYLDLGSTFDDHLPSLVLTLSCSLLAGAT